MTVPEGFDPAQWRAFELAGWETVAQGYHDWLGSVTTQAVEPVLDAVNAGAGTRLLDVATGPGYLAVAAVSRGASVIGVDFSAAVVAAGTQRYPGIEFREADAEALPFPDASFDAVTINFGMHHFARPDRALAEASRVLRPGGRIAFTVWAPSEAIRIVPRAVQALGDAALELPIPPTDLFGDSAQTERTIVAAGFLSPEIVTLPLVQRMDDPEAYFETVLTGAGPRQGSPLRAQAASVQAAIRSAVVRELRTYEKNGSIELPMPAVLTSAQKA
jgi:SAM-dependent methyltransferase